MLKEDQAAELLRQCEALVGKRLRQTRKLLRLTEHRAAALWELIVIDSAGQIGKVNYEPQTGGSRPDAKLQLSADRAIWLEAAFLHPRFWKEEQKCEAVMQWIGQELRRRSIAPGKVRYSFETVVRSDAGPKVQLPELRERDLFLHEPGLSSFLDAIQQSPSEDRSYTSPKYSVSLQHVADADGRTVLSTAPRFDAPQTLREHGLYRLLVEKADQHRASDLPLVICVGSDASPLLTSFPGPNQPENRRVVNEVFREKPWVSAVVVVTIASQRAAEGEIFRNPNARLPLSEDEIDVLRKLDFNRWRYTSRLERWDAPVGPEWIRRVWGNLILRPSGGSAMEVAIPSNILVEILAGRTTPQEELGPIAKPMLDRWGIVDCRFEAGDIQAGRAAMVVLKLAPIPPVYGLKEPTEKS